MADKEQQPGSDAAHEEFMRDFRRTIKEGQRPFVSVQHLEDLPPEIRDELAVDTGTILGYRLEEDVEPANPAIWKAEEAAQEGAEE